MNHIDVDEAFVTRLFESNGWERFGVAVENKTKQAPISESVEVEEEVNEDVETEFACPLCESDLDEPISESRLSEHIDTVLTLVSESLNEDSEDEEADEDSESPLAEADARDLMADNPGMSVKKARNQAKEDDVQAKRAHKDRKIPR
jgi:hypothetical protein